MIKTISQSDDCECKHKRYTHDKYGCQAEMFDLEETCNCSKFTPLTDGGKDGVD